jgi:hypothetical protein
MNLAVWIRQMRTVLADENQALGPDHTNPLQTRSDLIDLLAEAGELDEATEMSRTLLPDLVRALGHDHPDVREAEARHEGLVESGHDTDVGRSPG